MLAWTRVVPRSFLMTGASDTLHVSVYRLKYFRYNVEYIIVLIITTSRVTHRVTHGHKLKPIPYP